MADLSLREAYQHVVRSDDTSGVISLDAFFLPPQGVRHAIEMMVPGPSGWGQVADEGNWGGQDWTEECQGVATDGNWWFICSGGSKRDEDATGLTFGGSDMAIYTFALDDTGGSDSNARHIFVMADVLPLAAGQSIRPKIPMDGDAPARLYHFGAVIAGTTADASGNQVPVVFVDHWVDAEAHILVLRNENGILSFLRWVRLENHPAYGRMGMVAWVPEGDCFITSHGKENAAELNMHRTDGSLVRYEDGTPRSLPLQESVHKRMFVQGGAWSPRGHVYVSAGAGNCPPRQFIYNYSILTGRNYRTIEVIAEENNQELEGICLFETSWNGHPCQIFAVLLENNSPKNGSLAKDSVFFKAFAANEPDRV